MKRTGMDASKHTNVAVTSQVKKSTYETGGITQPLAPTRGEFPSLGVQKAARQDPAQTYSEEGQLDDPRLVQSYSPVKWLACGPSTR